MESTTSKYILLTIISLVIGILNCSGSNNVKNETPVNLSISGFWEGIEPGSDNYKIVFKIVEKDTQDYSGTGYGFQDGYYVEHYNLDSVSFNASTNALYVYNESNNFVYQGKVNFVKQSISGTIESYEVNGQLIMKRTEEKALTGLYPRGSIEDEIVTYEYKQPGQLNDGWETSTLEAEGVNSHLVTEAINKIIKQEFVNMTSLLIVKNNKLVCEEYFYGSDKSRLNRLASCSKSVTSLVFGIAIDDGEISGVDESVMSYFPEYHDLQTGENSKILTKHLLTMSAGLDWDEYSVPYNHPQNTLLQMGESDDYLKFIFERSMVDAPGDKFNYNCACTILLGWILEKSVGMRADKYAEQHLFNPLGIDDYYWHKREDGFPHVEGGLWLTARDKAKIGSLILNKGKWQGKQIVSKGWIEESIQKHMPQQGMQAGYGYQWWIMDQPANGAFVRSIMARGADPQSIIIIPQFNAVIVTTGSFTFIDWDKSPLRMLIEYIGPAVS